MKVVDSLFYFENAKPHEPEVDAWLSSDPQFLFTIARRWFNRMRECGDGITELIHDGCPLACVNGAAFAYVNVFKAHVNIGFYTGALLDDPKLLLLGSGKRMRHIKVKPDEELDVAAVENLIASAYLNVKNSSAS